MFRVHSGRYALGGVFLPMRGEWFVYRVRRVEVFVEAFFLRYFGMIGVGGAGRGGREHAVAFLVFARSLPRVLKKGCVPRHGELWLDGDGQPTVTSGGVVWAVVRHGCD